MDYIAANMNLLEVIILIVLSLVVFFLRSYKLSTAYWVLVIFYITVLRQLYASTVEINSPAITGYLLNVVLFMPFGFCCTRMNGKRVGWKAVLAGCVISCCVEAIQAVTALGYADVLDVFCNTAGAAAGYGISQIWKLS